jgi:hypothetical protein
MVRCLWRPAGGLGWATLVLDFWVLGNRWETEAWWPRRCDGGRGWVRGGRQGRAGCKGTEPWWMPPPCRMSRMGLMGTVAAGDAQEVGDGGVHEGRRRRSSRSAAVESGGNRTVVFAGGKTLQRLSQRSEEIAMGSRGKRWQKTSGTHVTCRIA